MSAARSYSDKEIARVVELAALGYSAALIAKELQTTRNAIASLCARKKIKLLARVTLQRGGARRIAMAKAVAVVEAVAADACKLPCLWPEGCSSSRADTKHAYCAEHNARAYVSPARLKRL